MLCKCGQVMVERGFRGHNRRFDCDCGLRFVPFTERYFGNNFLGYKKWSKI